jgi:ABC-type lipoprotein release transport system permease subunit
MKFGDSNYTRIYGIRLLAGRDLMTGDSVKELVINQTYARILGFKNPNAALGKTLDADNTHLAIVGVMADFHQASLRSLIKPLALNSTNHNYAVFHIALQQNNTGGGKNSGSTAWTVALTRIEKAYKAVYPEDDFEYHFFDDSIAKFYTAEQKISRLLRWATGLTIFISCLGLLGLVVYATQLRTKEIGVRKVLGASVTQIVSILSKDFVKLVCIAFVIAVPIAWWTAHKWLENFAYRTTISWWLYGLSGLAMLGIALLTLSIQTVRAANVNPVKSLRTE